MSKWKSFNDELPPVGKWVLVYGSKGDYFDLAYLEGNKMRDPYYTEVKNCTHWIALPEKPSNNIIGEWPWLSLKIINRLC